MRASTRAAARIFLAAGLWMVGVGSARADGIDWQQRVAARPEGADQGLVPVSPDEYRQRKVSRDIDYVTLDLEALYLHSLPGFREGSPVVLGAELDGVLRRGATLKTVSEVRTCQGKRCRLHFDELALVRPFIYGGENVSIRLSVRTLGASEANSVRGRIAAVGGLIAKIDPSARAALDTAARVFESVVGASTQAQGTWKHSLTLYPADQVVETAPDSLFTSARHVFLFLAPPDAPEKIRQIKPSEVLPKLKLLGRRLVWKKDEREYLETPYLVLTVRRYRRYPSPSSTTRKLRAQLEQALATDNLGRARTLIHSLQAAIPQESTLTVAERNLERAWLDDWRLRLRTARAVRRKDPDAELRGTARQLVGLYRIQQRFAEILEQTEQRELGYRQVKLRDRLKELTDRVSGGLPATLSSAIAEAQALPPPPGALTGQGLQVQLWTAKQEMREGDSMRVFVRGNHPFFGRLLYRDASGTLVQLLPNPDRSQSFFEANRVYEIPSAQDRFTMEVAPPFGTESLILYASSAPLGPLELEAVEQGMYVVKTPLDEVGFKTRGIRLRRKSGHAAPVKRADFVTAQVKILTRPK